MMTMAAAGPLGNLAGLDWRVVNDGVMGGVSSGQVVVEDRAVVFTGQLSLDNNGGFVSIRTAPRDLGLAGARELRVTVRGDGRVWDLTLRRADVPLRAGSYRVSVATTPEPVTVVIPLSAFRPTSFGRPVGGAPALDAGLAQIDSVGFLLADKQPGPYVLEVLGLEPVGEAAPRGPGLGDVRKALAAAVSVGVPAFNAGEIERCREVYADVLARHVAHPALTAGERAMVQEALGSAVDQPPTEGAWTLRHAIDTVLGG
jgi:hypothetical protein